MISPERSEVPLMWAMFGYTLFVMLAFGGAVWASV